jgi:cation diffusion facilitator CzcD-associated flavoprotein CzcO
MADQRKAHGYDAIVIGAGVSGLYQLYRLREAGFTVRVFEAGSDVGGTWYWNRYPGARFDSESWTYGYSFSEEVLQEWEWSEHFSGQPETLRYLNYIADKFDLRRDIQFDTRVTAATYDESVQRWTVEYEGGSASAQFLIPAIGLLSVPTLPTIDGMDSFEGLSFHTGQWPHEPVDFTGKRVAVIGTGATGVQVIQAVAQTAGTLTVFQRRPNWCAPLHNSPISSGEQLKIKSSYPEILALCNETFGAFVHRPDERMALDVTPEEREALWEKLYAEPGFGIWMANFRDLLIVEDANRLISEFIARKIRERVHDPDLAEKLIPKDHGFGTRRVPLESGYYEVFNQDNVSLVDLMETPIVSITSTGIKTADAEYPFDIIIYATGFDAVTGAFDRVDIRGIGGERLVDHWAEGPRTYLGIQYAGFPNLLAIVGPHNATTFCNMTRCVEHNVDWITGLICYMRDNSYTSVAPTPEAEEAWTRHVDEISSMFLFTKVDSWFTGINRNLSAKQRRHVVVYPGGAPAYRARCAEVLANGYEGFVFEQAAVGAQSG